MKPRDWGSLTKQEHDEIVEKTGRPVTQRPVKRRKPKEVTDMPASGYSIVDTYTKDEQ